MPDSVVPTRWHINRLRSPGLQRHQPAVLGARVRKARDVRAGPAAAVDTVRLLQHDAVAVLPGGPVEHAGQGRRRARPGSRGDVGVSQRRFSVVGLHPCRVVQQGRVSGERRAVHGQAVQRHPVLHRRVQQLRCVVRLPRGDQSGGWSSRRQRRRTRVMSATVSVGRLASSWVLYGHRSDQRWDVRVLCCHTRRHQVPLEQCRQSIRNLALRALVFGQCSQRGRRSYCSRRHIEAPPLQHIAIT